MRPSYYFAGIGILAVAAIICAFVLAPSPTPEQIKARQEAAAAQQAADIQAEQQRAEMRIKEMQATPPEVQAANAVGDHIDAAVGAYVGFQALKLFLGN